MIKCHLSSLLGQRRLKISEVARATGLNRNTVTLLYKEEATRVELATLESLCEYLECSISDLIEYIPNDA